MLDLKFKTETLESVVCSMDDGIIMFDGTGSVLYYNTQLLRFCQDITGRDISADTLREFACSFLPLACGAGDRVELPEFSEGYRAVIVHSQEQGRHVYTVRISPRQTEARSALALPASSRRVSVRSYLSYLRARRTARSPLCCISRCRQSKRTYQISFRKPESATALLC